MVPSSRVYVVKHDFHRFIQAAADMFRILMGDKVEPRRELIEKHALQEALALGAQLQDGV